MCEEIRIPQSISLKLALTKQTMF